MNKDTVVSPHQNVSPQVVLRVNNFHIAQLLWVVSVQCQTCFLSPNLTFKKVLLLLFAHSSVIFSRYQSGKPRGRQSKMPKHTVDSGGVINITDDSSSDTDGMDTDSNSSPDSLLDNDDVIFVNHTSCQTGREVFFSFVCFVSRSDV